MYDEGGHFTEEEDQLSWCLSQFRCNKRGVHTGVKSLGGFHLVVIEVVPVNGRADKKVHFISIKKPSG